MANENQLQDVEGYSEISAILMTLINTYPGLDANDTFKFSVLNENNGKSVFPISGSVIESEKRDILGRCTQMCVYPFYVIYRVGKLNENMRKTAKEWLDNLGRWLEQQPIVINGTKHTLTAYPSLTDPTGLTRRITLIKRTSPAVLDDIQNNAVEDWMISITLKYTNEFMR